MRERWGSWSVGKNIEKWNEKGWGVGIVDGSSQNWIRESATVLRLWWNIKDRKSKTKSYGEKKEGIGIGIIEERKS